VSITWKEHRIIRASILSTLGGSLSLKVEDERKFLVDGHKYTGPIITKAGRKYSIALS
jgi:hypothetical protein